ncbi:MAG: CDP-alcohol phosphatidyltransferase family protein [Bacteroidales bacterium]|nr:CDP-alcohol phosphatidyltransferase family protein [Bacteroidales bacterium]
MAKQIANIITGCRILGSILLLFFPISSLEFYVLYLLCGFSDMIDGFVARKTNRNSSFGAKFDTIADFIFMIIVCYKLLSAIHIPLWEWIWIIVITIIKLSNIIWGLIRTKSLISIHSTLNKVTGFVLFLLPLTIQFIELEYSLFAVCLIATFAAIQEGYYIVTGDEIT